MVRNTVRRLQYGCKRAHGEQEGVLACCLLSQRHDLACKREGVRHGSKAVRETQGEDADVPEVAAWRGSAGRGLDGGLEREYQILD